jgi:hypothetical protein
MLVLVLGLYGCGNDSTTAENTQPASSEQSSAESSDNPLVGTYEVVMFEDGKAVDNATLPPGQARLLKVNADGTWILRDMMTGVEGTWEMRGERLVLRPTKGPAGPAPAEAEPMVLEPQPDRTRLVIVEPADAAGMIEMRYDPEIEQKMQEATQKRMQEGDEPRQNP